MGRKKMRMKMVAVCLVAAVLVVVESAPINGDELLQNIQTAAEAEVEKDDTETTSLNAQADAEEDQIASNRIFAKDMAGNIEEQMKKLDRMAADEKQSIADAEAIETDTTDSDIKDIESKDQDAEEKSHEIQETAEQVDKALLESMEKMRSVGIEVQDTRAGKSTGKKAAKKVAKKVTHLGESRFGDDEPYDQRLKTIEADAHAMVDQAEKDKETANAREQKADRELDQMTEMGKTGMAQLTKSEAQLHRDLDGHLDTDLEKDIESKVDDIESGVQQDYTSEADESARSNDGVAAIDSDEAGFAQGKQAVDPNFGPTKLGESGEPGALEAAEAAAEAASADSQLDSSADYTADGASPDAAEDASIARAEASYNAEDASSSGAEDAAAYGAEEEATADTPVSQSGSTSSDLKDIDNDAHQLVDYQKHSLDEIKQIEAPLQ